MFEEVPLIDAYFNGGAKGEIHEVENKSSLSNEEELNPENPQTLQEWMMEYENSCRKLMTTYNSQEIFSHFCEKSKRLRNTKREYKENPTNDLLLEAFYQNHVVNTLEIILSERVEEEKSSLSKEENECHPNQHQMYSEESKDSEEDHDS